MCDDYLTNFHKFCLSVLVSTLSDLYKVWNKYILPDLQDQLHLWEKMEVNTARAWQSNLFILFSSSIEQT